MVSMELRSKSWLLIVLPNFFKAVRETSSSYIVACELRREVPLWYSLEEVPGTSELFEPAPSTSQ